MVYTCTSRVEEHRDGGDKLTGENDENRLPPVQPNADHSRPKSPISKRETKVKGHEVPPSPCPLFGRRWVQILITPCNLRTWMAMLIERRIVSLDKIFKSFTAAKRVLQNREFLSSGGLEFCERIGGAHRGYRGVEISAWILRGSELTSTKPNKDSSRFK